MADFVNPVDLGIVLSANDMPAPWVVCTRAQAESWGAIPTKYRKWVTDHIEEMTAGEKTAKDLALLTAARDAAIAEQIDTVESAMRAFMLTVLDELNLHAAKHNAILDAVDAATNLADLKTRVGAIADYPQRTANQLRTTIRNKLGN